MSTLADALYPNISLSGQDLQTEVTEAMQDVTAKTNEFGNFFLGVGISITIFFLLYSFFKLSMSSDNEMERRRALMSILTAGGALALFGGFGTFLAFFSGLL